MGFTDVQVERLLSLENSAFYHGHYEPMAHAADLREGAVDILTHAQTHGVQTLILSNHIVDAIRPQLRRLNIEHLFGEVLAYADRATQFRDMTKGERLRRYMQKHGMTQKDAIIVGDSVEEIEIAHEQGLIGVAITGGCASEERLRKTNPHHVIHSLTELKPILQERGFTS
jgi:phosphoglycolate phosphatase